MSQVWRNGERVSGDSSPGVFPAGSRLFETFALREGRVACLEDHLVRLRAGLSHLRLNAGPLASGDITAWRAAVAALSSSDSILRLVVGEDFEELSTRALLPSPEVFTLRTLRTRRDAAEWMPRPKSAPWANSLAALEELRTLGVPAGVEGVQLDARGFVSECARSSIAWVVDGTLCVPAPSTQRLLGTALAQFAACSGLPMHEVMVEPPTHAEAVVILRSTLPGGGAPVTAWTAADGRVFWKTADLSCARELLARLAAWRSQRSINLA